MFSLSLTCPKPAPLIPIPMIEGPFDLIVLGIPFTKCSASTGPFPSCSVGYQHIPVIMDYATWFLEAISLCSLTAPKIMVELMK